MTAADRATLTAIEANADVRVPFTIHWNRAEQVRDRRNPGSVDSARRLET